MSKFFLQLWEAVIPQGVISWLPHFCSSVIILAKEYLIKNLQLLCIIQQKAEIFVY